MHRIRLLSDTLSIPGRTVVPLRSITRTDAISAVAMTLNRSLDDASDTVDWLTRTLQAASSNASKQAIIKPDKNAKEHDALNQLLRTREGRAALNMVLLYIGTMLPVEFHGFTRDWRDGNYVFRLLY